MPIEKNDLTIPFNGSILNIRVLLLIKTKTGFLFEHHTDGYYFAIGGRVKLGETTREAAAREIQEEIQRTDVELKLTGLIENFFVFNEEKIQELNFVYSGELLGDLDLVSLHSDHQGFVCLTASQVANTDVKPKAVLQLLKSTTPFTHLVNHG